MMTLESAIRHCEEVAEEQDRLCKANDEFNFSQPKWRECAKDHRQLAEWLRKYQKIQEIISDFRKYQKGISCGFGGTTYMQMISEVVEDGNDKRRST
jgi:hypothetical protein